MFFFFMVKGMSLYFFFLILVVRFLFAIILCDLVFEENSAGKKTFLSSTDPERFSEFFKLLWVMSFLRTKLKFGDKLSNSHARTRYSPSSLQQTHT